MFSLFLKYKWLPNNVLIMLLVIQFAKYCWFIHGTITWFIESSFMTFLSTFTNCGCFRKNKYLQTFWTNRIAKKIMFKEIMRYIFTPAGIYLLKVSGRSIIRTRCEISSQLTMKTPELRQIFRKTELLYPLIHTRTWIRPLIPLFHSRK